jgi:hypothetical protein
MANFLCFVQSICFCHDLFTPCIVFFFVLASFREFAKFYFSENEKN